MLSSVLCIDLDLKAHFNHRRLKARSISEESYKINDMTLAQTQMILSHIHMVWSQIGRLHHPKSSETNAIIGGQGESGYKLIVNQNKNSGVVCRTLKWRCQAFSLHRHFRKPLLSYVVLLQHQPLCREPMFSYYKNAGNVKLAAQFFECHEESL